MEPFEINENVTKCGIIYTKPENGTHILHAVNNPAKTSAVCTQHEL